MSRLILNHEVGVISQSWVGKTIGGRYQIEALLGQGGMSAVYRAYDPNLRRTVAVKLIHPHLSTDPNFIGRFKEEAAAVARLRHPNIVQVHDFDKDGETYYMVMEYLIGETLQTRLKRLNSTGRYLACSEAINICTQISDAAGYAHDHELIHRDIKPANIMLDVNQRAILMDFGIVKIIGGEYHTSTGATIGTAMYMSPEQIRGERIDDRSDIYSLGVTLYEMLSGRPPYQAESAVTLMMMVLNDPLPDLRRLRQQVPDELLCIVHQALEKDKTKRYQSMAELTAALLPLQGMVENAPPFITLVESDRVEPSAPAPPSPQPRQAEDKFPETVKEAVLPIEPSGGAPVSVDLQGPGEQKASVSTQPVIPASSIPIPHIASTEKPPVSIRKLLRRFLLPMIGVVILAVAAFFGYQYFTSKRPPAIQLSAITYAQVPLNAATATNMVSLGKWETDSYVEEIEFSPDGSSFITANDRDWLRSTQYRYYGSLWQVDPPGLQAYLLGQSQWVADAAFSPDGKLTATVSDDASIYIWQPSSGVLERKIETTYGGITGVDFSPNNLLLAASSWDGYLGLWQLSNGNLLRTMDKQEYGLKNVEFSPDGNLLAAGSDLGTVLVWKVSDVTPQMSLEGHTAAITKVAFSPDGRLIASASEDHSIRLWKLSNGSYDSLLGHSETVKDIAFSPDGTLLVSGSEDGTIRLWQVKDGQLLYMVSEEEPILSIAFSPDGYYMAAGEANGVIHFWGHSEALPPEATSTPSAP